MYMRGLQAHVQDHNSFKSRQKNKEMTKNFGLIQQTGKVIVSCIYVKL